MLKALKARYNHAVENSRYWSRVIAILSWLETQEAHIFIIKDRVEVDIMGTEDGHDVKYCTGVGSDLLSALEAAYLHRAQQTGQLEVK